MASDRSIISDVRERTGLSDTSKWPDSLIKKEIERGKQEINKEVNQRTRNIGTLNIFKSEAAEDALKSFVTLRMLGHKNPRAGRKGTPKTVSEMRRTRLPDSAMSEQAKQVQANLRRLWEDGN